MVGEPQPSQADSIGSTPNSTLRWLYGHARRVVVFVVGLTVLLIGIAMIVLPGPAVVVIPLGLAILATEFLWAKKWLEYAKQQAQDLTAFAVKNSRNEKRPPRVP